MLGLRCRQMFALLGRASTISVLELVSIGYLVTNLAVAVADFLSTVCSLTFQPGKPIINTPGNSRCIGDRFYLLALFCVTGYVNGIGMGHWHGVLLSEYLLAEAWPTCFLPTSSVQLVFC